MKINKKLIVPFLSTVVGLSIAGGLGGAFAWYQFNSQVRTGLIGSSVAEAGVLQIGYKDNQDNYVWGSNRNMPNATLIPVTFGALKDDGTLPQSYAFGYPEAGQQGGNSYGTGWTEIQNGHGFVQYDIYLRALKADANAAGDPNADIAPGYKLVEQDVYLSEIILEDVETENKTVEEALRVHYQVEGGKNELISKTAITSQDPLNLHGKLDLDGDGQWDTPANTGHAWNTSTTPITYGINGQTQVTKGIADVRQARDSDGKMPEHDAQNPNPKCVCRTSTGVMTKITITVWLEGWSLLTAIADPDNPQPAESVWNPKVNADIDVHVGLTFDVGRNILE